MITVDLTLPSGDVTRNALLMLFSVNDNSYAATIRIDENNVPYPVDVALYIADIHSDGTFDLYDSLDQKEYLSASNAFSKLLDYL